MKEKWKPRATQERFISTCNAKRRKIQPRDLPKPSRTPPGTFQNRSRAALGKHLAARRHPRALKRRPGSRQGAAQSAQERPKSAQEPPKRHTEGDQTLPKSVPERLRTPFLRALGRNPCRRSCRADFFSFFASRAGWTACSDVRFVPLLPVFC